MILSINYNYMRKVYFIFFFLILPFLCYSQTIPKPVGWVNDFANVIDESYKEKLNSLIGELEQKTSAEIAVVTVGSIAPYDEKQYARLLFDNWKPGKKGKDNGVLVLLAIKERRWRIEAGYGVEGILPDGLCGEIGRTYMVPYFKNGNYSQGLYEAVSAITNVITKDANITLTALGDFKEQPLQKQSSNAANDSSIIVLFILIIIVIIVMSSFTSNKSRYYGGGHYYGGYGGGGFSGGGFGGFGGGGGGGGGAGGGF